MYSTITASSRFKIYAAVALAALLMTLLAVTLTTGQAQATTTDTTTIALSGDDNSIPQQQGTPHATPEACPGETGNDNAKAASVVDSGHYALFDVWWNDDEGELTNTVCPPSVTTTTGRDGTMTTTRAASSIDITAEPPTIIHIPNSAMVNLSTSTKYTKAAYPDVWKADDAENPNGDGDRMVWALPACPPDGDPSDVGLCLSFSAALLNDVDWDGNIEFIVTHVHQVDIDKQDRRYVLVYDGPAPGTTGDPDLRWYSADQDEDTVNVAAGGYDRPMWFFPSRGAYEFQVYIRGNPDTTKSNPIATEVSVTSDERNYILHVGAEADLGVGVFVEPAEDSGPSVDPGDEVTVSISARNAGPDAAPSTKVNVTLPEGLTYLSHSTETGTYADGVWSIDQYDVSSSWEFLDITATVDARTHGKTLTAKATISATETVTTNSDDYDVPVPDPDPTNNTDTDKITVVRGVNDDPLFQVTRSVPEDAPGGTLVGDPISVREPNSGDTLTFGITGSGAGKFTASSVSGGAQIAVASGAYLDYESYASYPLVLTVSDGKDAAGKPDTSVDHTIGVLINVTDVPGETFKVTLNVSDASPNVGEPVTFTATYHNPPAFVGRMNYIFVETTNGVETERTASAGRFQPTTRSKSAAGTHAYHVEFWLRQGDLFTHRISTKPVTVTWSAPSK